MRSVIGGSVVGYRSIEKALQILIDGLISDGVFAKLDRLWVFARATEALALVDLVASASATTVNSPTFASNRGYTFDGATNYINSGYNPATNGVNFVRDSAHIGFWGIVLDSPDGFPMLGGCSNGTSIVNIYCEAVNAYGIQVNDNLVLIGATSPTPTGFLLGTRTGATARAFYVNGTSDGSDARISLAVPSVTVYISARSDSGTPGFYGGNEIAAVTLGGGLTATEASNFYTRLRTYMTAVGVP